MKERPILFSGPMVRAILNGSKSQTRRVVKPQPVRFAESGWSLPGLCCTSEKGFLHSAPIFKCPYGQPGDRLWVRETFADLTKELGRRWERFNPETKRYEIGQKPFFWYRADGEQPDPGNGTPLNQPWKPSIHMPRWASRITLEITGVRVERLQDISPADCEAEGVHRLPLQENEPSPWYTADVSAGPVLHSRSTIGAYHKLWECINGPGSWDANPWVWVVEFRVMKPGEVNQQGATR